ncbi:MFS transporter [Mobiluncus mulieris]|uniref:MFS transporter n=1 Tax=Mobiluncus mulieris TaxID=2052 RepID=UPI00019F92CE|nr:MFS transporter [Mobiluncus mulieris]EEJ52791.1 transporter, major facilitator family protein [Mobiluncus mulieris ATCC 35243]MCV0001906.1 MFS transporter [Mobiluncus mulieris]MCV0009133.1 MFS transporter [Mobiluncus mulieris]NMX00882.1 MFS transporter [Mobiluncus mulieris]NMX18704.1 MFS transporter [Mobiluncus mulieris]
MASKTFRSLSYPNFRLWFVSNLCGATAVWMQRVAQIWVVLVVLTRGDAFAVGITTALQFMPSLLVGLFGGSLADWVNRRKFIQITQLCISTLGLVLGMLILGGWAQLGHVYLIAFVAGMFDAVAVPLRQTFLSELVPKDAIPNAVGLNSTAFNIARLIGPGLAGVLIAAIGVGWVFVLNFVIFLVPIGTLAVMREEHFYPVERGERRRGMFIEGLRYAHSRSDLKAIFLLVCITNALGFNLQMTQAFMATEVYGRGPGEYGLLGTMLAVGSLTGALAAARRTRPRFALVVGFVFLFGVFEGLMAVCPNYWVFALASVPTGYAMITLLTGANALIQVSTPETLRGRVLSIYFLFNLGSTPLGSPLVGWVGNHFGARWSLGVGALACIGVALVVFAWAMHTWRVRLGFMRRWPFLEINGPRERYYHRGHGDIPAVDPKDPGYTGGS